MAIHGTEGCFEQNGAGAVWTTRHGVERLDDTLALGCERDRRCRLRLPAALRDDEGHLGSHAYLVDDFVRASAWRLQPPVNVWQAARYLLPGLTADRSARRGGELLEVIDFGAGPEVDRAAFERPLEAIGAVSGGSHAGR
jgi:hypothetical protein